MFFVTLSQLINATDSKQKSKILTEFFMIKRIMYLYKIQLLQFTLAQQV